MTSEQFEALAKLISLRGGQSQEAARRVLVGEEAPSAVAADLGVTPQQAWREWYGGLPGGGAPSSTWVEECAGGLPCNANALSCAPYK